MRAAFEDTDHQEGGLPERLGRHTGGLDALETVAGYASRLLIHRSTTTHTNLDVIAAAVKDVIVEHGAQPLVIVDYLQKVRPRDAMEEEAAITHVTERLKDLAIEFDCPVLAISASDRAGLEPGTRMRARNMKGSTSLAYEADVVLVLANKADIVARHHLMYSAGNGEHFKGWSVLTVEKNRSGRRRRRAGVPQGLRPRPLRARRRRGLGEAGRRAGLRRVAATTTAGRRTAPSPRDEAVVRRAGGHSAGAASSAATFLVRFGSTWTPGPMVVETVTFLM